jgi:threonine/homoserine/homoserine lactone efflux protein
MEVWQALLAFSLAAGLLTITPGLDTAIVLRTAAVEGPRRAALAAAGVIAGCLVWGAAVALGLGVLLQASSLAFTLIKWAGCAYLVWLGIGLILKPRDSFQLSVPAGPVGPSPGKGDFAWMRRGFLTNLLNPKVGVFYVSFLPQFLPAGVAPGPFIFLLAALHGVMGLAWFAVLIGATRPLQGLLQRAAVVRWLDRLTGGVFLAFGVRLALERR